MNMSEQPPPSSSSETIIMNDQLINLDLSTDLHITCFSHVFNDISLHFQIIRFPKQIYAWIGCNSTKLGPLYAAAPTRPNNVVSVSSLLGGTSDNTGSGIARRIEAEKKLVQKLSALGYTKSIHQESS